MKNKTIIFSTALLMLSGLALSGVDFNFVPALAEEVIVEGSFAKITSYNANGSFYFTMAENDAPFDDWSIRYKPESVDNITITQPDGTSYHIESAITQREAIVKYDADKYEFESWVYGSTRKPQEGDLVTIEGNFVRTDGGTVTKLNIQKSSFLIGKDSNNALYPINIPQTITNVSEKSTGFSMSSNTWWFLFNINGLSEDDAPITGDSYGYYPSSKECVYVNGNPIGKVDKHALRRRDPGSTEFYVVKQGYGEGQDFELNVGEIVVFDGLFVTNVPNPNYEKSKSIGIELSMLTFERTGTNKNDYKIIDLKEYISNKLLAKFNINLFKQEVREDVQAQIEHFQEDLTSAKKTGDVYRAFDEYSIVLSGYEYDPETTKELLESYVSLDDYFEEDQNQINAVINDAKAAIDSVADNTEIYDIYEAAKAEIDSIENKVDKMSNAILEQKSGYEDYLAPYNRVSLSNLNLGEITYHGTKEERANDLNTNSLEQQLINTFVPSADNENGNVVFQFKYRPNAAPKKGANALVVLRGTPYCGYKFAVDTDSRGCYLEIIDSNFTQIAFEGGTSYIFENGNEYNVELGAIDLLHDVNKTWLYMKVDGVYTINKVVNTLDIGVNPRVSLSPNDNSFEDNDYEGTVTLSSLDTNISNYASTYFGAFTYKDNQEVSKQNIRLTLDNNALPIDTVAYPLNESSIKLVRGDVTTNIAKPEVVAITKLTEKDYKLDISKIAEIEDGDTVIVDGDFAYYSNDAKHSFTIAPSRYKYHEQDNSWEVILTLEEYKEDVKRKLDNYVDLSLYDDEEKTTVNSVINTAKNNIDDAADINAVKALFEQAKGQLDAVKTSLDKYKEASIAIINGYKNDELNKYRDAEKEDIASLKRLAVEDVNAASSRDEVDSIVVGLKLDIDDLKTDEDYKVEELAEAKKEATSKIRNHYASLDLSKYSDEEKTKLDRDTTQALADIKAANSIEEINQIVDTYINAHKQQEPEQSSSSKKCGGNIIVTSVILSAISLIGITLLLINKRKEY